MEITKEITITEQQFDAVLRMLCHDASPHGIESAAGATGLPIEVVATIRDVAVDVAERWDRRRRTGRRGKGKTKAAAPSTPPTDRADLAVDHLRYADRIVFGRHCRLAIEPTGNVRRTHESPKADPVGAPIRRAKLDDLAAKAAAGEPLFPPGANGGAA